MNLSPLSSPFIPSTPNISHSSSPSFSLKMGTLNCRSLAKTANPQIRSSFIRHLRSLSFDLLALQETHAGDPLLQDILHTQFQASSSIWSSHCGLVSTSSDIELSNSFISRCGRLINATVTHRNHLFVPFTITVVYFPVARSDRIIFLESVASSLFFPSHPSRHVVLGDFNYTYAPQSRSNSRQASADWLEYIDRFFVDAINRPGFPVSPTFKSHVGTSCIDYCFITKDMFSTVQRAEVPVGFLPIEWTDHRILSIPLRLPSTSNRSSATAIGKGYWKAHPRLARDLEFQTTLHLRVSQAIERFSSSLPAWQKWEHLKLIAAKTARAHSRRQKYSLACAETLLQRKRAKLESKVLVNPSLLPQVAPQLQVVQDQLTSLQRYHVETLALKAGIRWREQGELSAGYLKRTASSRAAKGVIPPLRHPSLHRLCISKEEMLDAAFVFYDKLYSPDPIDLEAVQSLLDSIPPSATLSSSDASLLMDAISFDEIVEAFGRCPKISSPGMDGLPYPIVKLIVLHPACREIVTQVYNDALLHGIFPPSWLATSVCLLPKTGDLADLRNWRPISLINADAKVFTRILNARFLSVTDDMINPYQSGFVRGRFIADNGLLMKLLMEHANLTKSPAIALLLDQEKAYDRVHPLYLQLVLERFGFPPTIVSSIVSLFFSTQLSLNINGFHSAPVLQRRGLRQGDPLSPVLFNLAFEPLLRSILASASIPGFSLPSPLTPAPSLESGPVKLLAYADDIACFLNTPDELQCLLSLLSTYSKASNALVNYHKTQAVSLSGQQGLFLSAWSSTLTDSQINQWHDARSHTPVRYLGYPLFSSVRQRDLFLNEMLEKIRQACQIHACRGLSVRGRVTVLNSLILSKLWHVLRVLSPPLSFFDKIGSVISAFVTHRIFPRLSYSTMCLPRSKGGLGLLHPLRQQGTLQLRWLIPLIADFRVDIASSTFSMDSESNATSSIVLPRLFNFYCSHSSYNPDYRLPFLFPNLRPPALNNLNSSLSLFFRALSLLPDSFDSVVASPATGLHLPVSSVVTHDSLQHVNRSLLSLPMSRLYEHDDSSGFRLRPIASRSRLVEFPNLCREFHRQVSHDTVKFRLFFIRLFIPPQYAVQGPHAFLPVPNYQRFDLQPFLIPWHLHLPSHLSSLSRSLFRRLCLLPSSNPPSSITGRQWASFWTFPLTHTGRNVWFRVLHGKIPTRAILHSWMPDSFPFSACLLCNLPLENLDHFVFSCPIKLAVWQSVWNLFFEGTVDLSQNALPVKQAVFALHFPPLQSSTTTRYASVVIGSTIHSLWRAHWSFVFDSRPFTDSTILAQTRLLINAATEEDFVLRGIPHCPLPFLSL